MAFSRKFRKSTRRTMHKVGGVGTPPGSAATGRPRRAAAEAKRSRSSSGSSAHGSSGSSSHGSSGSSSYGSSGSEKQTRKRGRTAAPVELSYAPSDQISKAITAAKKAMTAGRSTAAGLAAKADELIQLNHEKLERLWAGKQSEWEARHPGGKFPASWKPYWDISSHPDVNVSNNRRSWRHEISIPFNVTLPGNEKGWKTQAEAKTSW